MKQELSIEAVIASGEGLLARIAEVLNCIPRPPDCFVWSTISGTSEARIWLTFSEQETQLPDLADRLGRVPGVRRVTLHGAGNTLRELLVAPASPRSPGPEGRTRAQIGDNFTGP